MSVLKRLFCLAISLCLCLTLCACSNEPEPDNQEVVVSKPQTITIEKKEDEIDLIPLSDEASNTPLAKQDFAGAEITYYTTKEPTQLLKSKLSAFSKAHNCNIKIFFDPSGTLDEIAASIASKKPFDIVENDINSFSKTVSYNIYQPLQATIDQVDYYSSDRPSDSGLSSAYNSRFTINGNLIAVGSAQSTDFFVMYYNSSLFKKAEFEDPRAMWETGNWSFEEFLKMASVTSFVTGDALLQTPTLSAWLNIKGADALALNENSFAGALTQENIIFATTDYQNLIYGDTPICIPKSSSASFKNGKAYCIIDKASNISYWKNIAKTSSAFEYSEENVGCVVLPEDLSQIGAISAADVRCYSTLNGAKNPAAASCFALFDSRSFERKKTQVTLDDELTAYLNEAFNNKGFLPTLNLATHNNSNSVYQIIDDTGMFIRDGRRPKSMMNRASTEMAALLPNIPKYLPKAKK